MAIEDEQFMNAIKKLRETEVKRKFPQTVDLIVNLKNFDSKKDAFNVLLELPHPYKNKKVAGFFEKDSSVIDTITKDDFPRYKEKKDIRKLVKHYDFFIANARLMPAIATSFGRTLGPAGKMPSPQLGVILTEDEKTIKEISKKINCTIRIRAKEPSVKVGVAKDSLKDEEILKNVLAVYRKIIDTLPRKKDQVRNVLIKLTMDKPIKVEI